MRRIATIIFFWFFSVTFIHQVFGQEIIEVDSVSIYETQWKKVDEKETYAWLSQGQKPIVAYQKPGHIEYLARTCGTVSDTTHYVYPYQLHLNNAEPLFGYFFRNEYYIFCANGSKAQKVIPFSDKQKKTLYFITLEGDIEVNYKASMQEPETVVAGENSNIKTASTKLELINQIAKLEEAQKYNLENNLLELVKKPQWVTDTTHSIAFSRIGESYSFVLVVFADQTFIYKLDRCGVGVISCGKWYSSDYSTLVLTSQQDESEMMIENFKKHSDWIYEYRALKASLHFKTSDEVVFLEQ